MDSLVILPEEEKHASGKARSTVLGSYPQAVPSKKSNNLEHHPKRQVYVSLTAAQLPMTSCILMEINSFMIQVNVWNVSFYISNGKGRVFDERFIVTTCRW